MNPLQPDQNRHGASLRKNYFIIVVTVILIVTVIEWTWYSHSYRYGTTLGHSKLKFSINQQRSSNTQLHIQQEVRKVLNNIEKCMHDSNLRDKDLTAKAKQNAKHVLLEYRKVIPMEHLTDYNSHCWNTNYSVMLTSINNQRRVSGHIGNTAFENVLPRSWHVNKIHKELKDHFLGRFSSSTLCLPNLYLLGFGKCGSTFLWRVMSKILNHALGSYKVQVSKEPYFWTPSPLNLSLLPDAHELGGLYAPMFLRAVDPKYSSDHHKKVTLIDGCPNTVMGQPKLQTKDPRLANHCLFPSVLPQLFPDSKYLVIMRNPVDLLYSAFWWTVSSKFKWTYPVTDELGKSVYHNHLKGPEVFHKKVVKIIEEFTDCINHNCFEDKQHKCTLFSKNPNFSSCITQCTQWLTKCVDNVTTIRTIADTSIHRGIYYIHVLKWVRVVPKDRIHFIKMEGLSSDIYSTVKQTYEFIHNGERLPLSEGTVQNISLSCIENTNRVNYKSNPALWMRNDTRHILEEFFQPFNKMLSDLLEDEQFLWNDKQHH